MQRDRIADEAVRIPIQRRGGEIVGFALVDPIDAHLAEYQWHLGSNGYARRSPCFLMHREILGLGRGDPLQGDHINRDKLDNRRANLRVVTPAGNAQNRTANTNGRSRFRGVQWSSDRGKWLVRPRLNGRRYHVGYFDDEIEAARAADAWRLAHVPYAEPDPLLRGAA